jgi:hypothetical protein
MAGLRADFLIAAKDRIRINRPEAKRAWCWSGAFCRKWSHSPFKLDRFFLILYWHTTLDLAAFLSMKISTIITTAAVIIIFIVCIGPASCSLGLPLRSRRTACTVDRPLTFLSVSLFFFFVKMTGRWAELVSVGSFVPVNGIGQVGGRQTLAMAGSVH